MKIEIELKKVVEIIDALENWEQVKEFFTTKILNGPVGHELAMKLVNLVGELIMRESCEK